MGLFSKKFCDICGEKIGFLGNRKLEDGNLCKDCAGKLSPFFRERRSSTVEEIRAQLAYRAENEKVLKTFHPSLTFGVDEKVYLDVENKRMIVTSADDWASCNPDIIAAEQITAVETEIEDDEEELFYTDREGNEKSYDPPRYKHAYEFHVTFKIDSPWFDEIHVDLNNGERPARKEDDCYLKWQMRMQELASILRRWNGQKTPEEVLLGPDAYVTELRKKAVMGIPMEPSAPVTEAHPLSPSCQTFDGAWTCPACGAENHGKFCEECGTPRA
ncbi:MAG: DUF4428 domain-containing protein [Clostridia bacterium]|nr:DUF4428 domain-containing protein [Clostridia bacterium]